MMDSNALSDLEVYRRLVAAADALDEAARAAASVVGNAALSTAAQTVRGMAQTVYEHCLSDGDVGVH
jgi:hypothetical protein